MKASQLIPARLLQDAHSAEITVFSICDHTEQIKSGDLFICKAGEHFNPVYLLPTVARKGAAAIVAESGTPIPPLPTPVIFVTDIQEAEAEIWHRFYGMPAKDMTLIGITGTNGKTSTAKILSHIFQSTKEPCGYIGTLGTFINGVLQETDPLSLTTPSARDLFRTLSSMKRKGVKKVVMEVSSHALAQKRIHGIRFAVGLFTNLTEDHLDYHKTKEAYFEAKSRLFNAVDRAIINIDDPYGKKLSQMLTIPKAECGIIENAPFRVTDLHENGWEGTEYTCITPYGKIAVRYPLFGAFNVYNTLLAIASALECGICPEEVRRALLTLPSMEGRLERLSVPGVTVIIDYAHTPDAMEQAIKAVRQKTKGRLFVLFGAGGNREKEKRWQMGRIAETYADFCFITSDNCRNEKPSAIISDILSGMAKQEKRQVISDRRTAIQIALSRLHDQDTLLLLGKGHENYLITSEGKIPFSEKEIVYEYIKEHPIA